MSDEPPAAPLRPAKPIPFRVLIPWALVAALAVTCAWLVQLHLTARAEIALLQDQQALTNLEIIGARHQTEAGQIIHKRELSETKRHLAQLEEQIAQATRQVAEARRENVEISARAVAHQIELMRTREKLAAAEAELADLKQRVSSAPDSKP